MTVVTHDASQEFACFTTATYCRYFYYCHQYHHSYCSCSILLLLLPLLFVLLLLLLLLLLLCYDAMPSAALLEPGTLVSPLSDFAPDVRPPVDSSHGRGCTFWAKGF